MTGQTSQPAKVQVRPVTPPLTALRVETPKEVELPTGVRQLALKGQWLITRDAQVLEVVNQFSPKYEAIRVALMVSDETCKQLEQSLGIGTTKSANDLLGAVRRLAKVEIGSVEIPFTPGQLEEIAHRAQKRGISVQQEVQRIVERIKDEIFYKS